MIFYFFRPLDNLHIRDYLNFDLVRVKMECIRKSYTEVRIAVCLFFPKDSLDVFLDQ